MGRNSEATRKQLGSNKALVRSLVGLSVFGAGYAYFVHRLGDKHRGYTWTLVVFGEGVILAVMGPIIGWKNTLKLLAAHAAAGFWMSIGDILKGVNYMQKLLRGYQDTAIYLASRGQANNGEVTHDTEKRAG